MSYDYEAKGRADFDAGTKDERLYSIGEPHGAAYRKGWQQARREAEARAEGLAVPNPGQIAPVAPEIQPPAAQSPDDVPDFVAAAPIKEGAAVVLDPEGRVWPVVSKAAERVEPTKEDQRLHAGEDKPAKPEKRDPDQLDLFG